jgi:hypothetical protein
MSDETGEFFPFRDESGDEPEKRPTGRTPSRDDDATTVYRAGDDSTAVYRTGDDATRVQRPVGDDATRVQRPVGDDATRVQRPVGDDATRVQPGGGWGQEDAAWSGRAGVRAPQRSADVTGTDWADPRAQEPRGRWWMPILVTAVALVLLAGLGWAVYTIARGSQGGEEEQPAPGPTASAPVAPPPTSEQVTSPPTSVPVTTPPRSEVPSAAADLTIPALRGLSQQEAQAAMSRAGLNYRLRYIATTDAPGGTVIGSDPAEGRQVPADTVVNVLIASEPTRTATATPTPSPGETDTD